MAGREDAQGQQAAAAPQHQSDSHKQKTSEAKDGARGAAVSSSTGGTRSEARQPQPEADARQNSPTRSATRAGGSTDTASDLAIGAVAPCVAAKPQRALQQPGMADTGQAATLLASTKAAAAQGMDRPSSAKEPEKAILKPQKKAGAAGEAASAGAGKAAPARPSTPAAALQSSRSNRGTQAAHENPAAPKHGQTSSASQGLGAAAAAAAAKPTNAVTASAPSESVAAASQAMAGTEAAQASSQPAPHGAPPSSALHNAPEAARDAVQPVSAAQQAQHGSAAPKAAQAPRHPSALIKQGQDRVSAVPSHGAPAAAGAAVRALAKSAPRPGQPGRGTKFQAPSRPADSGAQGKPVPPAASASRVFPSLADREKAGELKGGSIAGAGAPKLAIAAAPSKATVQPAARTPIPAPMQAAPVSSASSEQKLTHQKEDKAARVSRFAPVGYTPAAGGAPKVQISRPAAGGSGAGGPARLQQGSTQLGSAQRAGIDARQDPHAKVWRARLQHLPGTTWQKSKNKSPCCVGCFTKQCRCEGDVCPASKQSVELMHQAMTFSRLQPYLSRWCMHPGRDPSSRRGLPHSSSRRGRAGASSPCPMTATWAAM